MELLSTRAPRWRAVAAAAVVMVTAIHCDVDAPAIFEPEPGEPLELSQRPGIFRLTFNVQPDLYPTWIDSVTVSYRGRGLVPYDTGFVLLQRSIRGGPAWQRETNFRARAAEFGLVPIGVRVIDGGPFPTYWMPAKNDVAVCSIPCPPAAALAVRVIDPSASDSTNPLPGWGVLFNRVSAMQSGTNQLVSLRLLPEDLDARDRGMNPFGPAHGLSLTPFYVSTGTAIYRGSGSPTSPSLDSITDGSYPALAPGGALLAFTRIEHADSTTATCTIPFGLGACIQTTVTISEAGRTIWVRDLASGDERSLGPGWAPAFDVTGTRVVVATPGGLEWIDVASGGRTAIPNTGGAHSPAVSPDGSRLAFVAEWSGQPDVYFMAVAVP